ncbi:hypothetical protein ABT214_23525, partial [Micromonospora purpureochromogenes]
TMLIGANDACTSSESTMTPVATYRTNIDSALVGAGADAAPARCRRCYACASVNTRQIGRGQGHP